MKHKFIKAKGKKIHRRSGNAVVEYCKLIGFDPDIVVLVGVGMNHSEIDVMRENWESFELYGFEPNPDICKSISNFFPGLLHQCAITDEIGIKSLYSNRSHKDGSCIHLKKDEELQEKLKTFKINTATLDAKLYNLLKSGSKNRTLLWLDCEGCEDLALKGGQKFINQNVDLINVEMTGNPRNFGWAKPVEVHRMLSDLGFLQCWVHTTRSCIGQFDAIYIRKELFQPEFCSCPDSIERWNVTEKILFKG